MIQINKDELEEAFVQFHTHASEVEQAFKTIIYDKTNKIQTGKIIRNIISTISHFKQTIKNEALREIFSWDSLKIISGDLREHGYKKIKSIHYMFPVGVDELGKLDPSDPDVIIITVSYEPEVHIAYSSEVETKLSYFHFSSNYKLTGVRARGSIDVVFTLADGSTMIFDDFRGLLEPLGIVNKKLTIEPIYPEA